MTLFIGIVIGLFVGWNWPQPPAIRELQERLVYKLQSLLK